MISLFSVPRHGVALPARPPSPDPHARQTRRLGGAPTSDVQRPVDDDAEVTAQREDPVFKAHLKTLDWNTMADAKAAIKHIEHTRSACALKGASAARGGKSARLLCRGAPDCKVFYNCLTLMSASLTAAPVLATPTCCMRTATLRTYLLSGCLLGFRLCKPLCSQTPPSGQRRC